MSALSMAASGSDRGRPVKCGEAVPSGHGHRLRRPMAGSEGTGLPRPSAGSRCDYAAAR